MKPREMLRPGRLTVDHNRNASETRPKPDQRHKSEKKTKDKRQRSVPPDSSGKAVMSEREMRRVEKLTSLLGES